MILWLSCILLSAIAFKSRSESPGDLYYRPSLLQTPVSTNLKRYLKLLYLHCKVTTEPLKDVSIPEDISYVNILKQSLQRQQWSSDERPCFDTMMVTLNEAQNFTLWAVWVLDSLGLPNGVLYGRGSHFGNYDECLSPRKAFEDSAVVPVYKYCLASLYLTSDAEEGPFSRKPNVTADHYLKKKTAMRRNLSHLKWGLCVPKVCQPQSVTKIARAILQTTHLRHMDQTTNIDIARCESGNGEGTVKEYSKGFYIFIIIVIIMVLTTVWFTYRMSTRTPQPDTFASEFARSFCIKRNLKELSNVRDDEIYCMNLIRNVSMYLLITGHMFIMLKDLLINALDFEDVFKGIGSSMLHAEVIVDTFFTMSALLFLRGMFTDKHKSPLKYMWKRYVRLMTAMAILIAYNCFMFEKTGEGPIWDHVVGQEARSCKTNWLHSFLMISNIIDPKRMCILIAWYVPADFQLSILIAVLFCVYQRNKKAAMISFWVLFSIGIIVPAYEVYFYEYFIFPFHGIEIVDIRLNVHFTDYYMKPTSHMGPFMLGALMGFIMYTYKPKDHRKCISKLKSYIFIVVALCLMAATLWGGARCFFAAHADRVSLGAAVFGGVNRSLWGLAICLLIAVSEYGDIPVLQKICTWSPLVPLSRLSYEVYLLQYPVALTYSEAFRGPITLDRYDVTIMSTGVTVLCYVVGLFVWLFIEGPFMNVNHMLLYKTWKVSKEKPVAAVNGKLE